MQLSGSGVKAVVLATVTAAGLFAEYAGVAMAPARADSESAMMGVGGSGRTRVDPKVRRERRRERSERQQQVRKEYRKARQGPQAYVHSYNGSRRGRRNQSAQSGALANQVATQSAAKTAQTGQGLTRAQSSALPEAVRSP